MATRDEDQLRQVRRLAAIVMVFLVACIVLADTLGRLFVNVDFHADTAILGTIVGGLLVILGVEVPAWFRRRAKGDE